jgi:hypothetical protein
MKELCSQNNNLSIDNKNNKIMSTGVSTNDDKYICKYCGDKFIYRQSDNKIDRVIINMFAKGVRKIKIKKLQSVIV